MTRNWWTNPKNYETAWKVSFFPLIGWKNLISPWRLLIYWAAFFAVFNFNPGYRGLICASFRRLLLRRVFFDQNGFPSKRIRWEFFCVSLRTSACVIAWGLFVRLAIFGTIGWSAFSSTQCGLVVQKLSRKKKISGNELCATRDALNVEQKH